MKRRLVLAAFFLALLAGCVAPQTPKARLQLAVESYSLTMDILVAAYHAKLIPAEAVPRIDLYRQLAWGALQDYRECVLAGRPHAAALARFNNAMLVLLAERAKVEGKVEHAD